MFTMGMVGNKIAYKAFENYLKVFVPLVLTAVGLSLAFKMRFWNIGGEGQFIVGAIVAAVVAFKAGAVLPGAVTLLLMCLAAMAAAGAYGAIAAALKVRFGTNETLLTLMLNYIALYALIFLGETKAEWNFLLNPESARPTFGSFASLASFPGISIGKFNLNVCVILTFVIGVLVFIYLKYTKHGYEIAVVGDCSGHCPVCGHQGKPGGAAHGVSIRLSHRPGRRLQGGHCRHPVYRHHRRRGLDGRHRGVAGQAEHGGHLPGVRPHRRAGLRLHRGRVLLLRRWTPALPTCFRA